MPCFHPLWQGITNSPNKQAKHTINLAEVYPSACRITHKKSPAIPPICRSYNHKKEQKSYCRQVVDYNGK